MLSKIFFGLLAATAALALPGGGGYDEEQCYTTCYTELCTESQVYQKTSVWYETTTNYYPVTSYQPSTCYYTKTLTSSQSTAVVTSTAYTTVIYKPVTYTTWVPVPYTTVYSEVEKKPYVTSTASASVCTESQVYPYTTYWVETSTECSTVTPAPTWGKSW